MRDATDPLDALPNDDGSGGEGNDDDELPVGERHDDEEESKAASFAPAGALPPAMPFPLGEESTVELDIARELSRLLARESERLEASRTEEVSLATEPVLCFLLGDVWLGALTSNVRQVVAMPAIYPVPTTPAFLLGVANLNGQVTPVIDLRRFLGIEAGETHKSPFAAISGVGGVGGGGSSMRDQREIGTRRMVVVHAEGLAAGFPVDLVREVHDIPSGLFQEARVSQGRVREFSRGELPFRSRVLTLLDLAALLKSARIEQPGSLQGTGEPR